MSTEPDRLYIARTDRELYDKLQDEDMFKSKTRKEQFLFAMAMGFRNQVRQQLDTREGIFLAKDMGPEDEALVDAVALHSSDSADGLLDRKAVFQIAEEYAHAGIRLVLAKIEAIEFGSFDKAYEGEVRELREELGLT
jgi:hypothetical protein